MFSLIITIISIALVAALALATLYYGGDAFNQGRADAEASKILNQGQQMLGAADLFHANRGRYPNNVAELVSADYLKSIPLAQATAIQAALAAEPWEMPTANVPVFVLDGVGEDACVRVNARSYGIDGILELARTGLQTQCFGPNPGPQKVVISKGASHMTAAATVGNAVLASTEVTGAAIPLASEATEWERAPGANVASGGEPAGGNAFVGSDTNNTSLDGGYTDLVFTNSATTPQSITSAVLSAHVEPGHSADFSGFSVTANNCSNVAPGASCTISLSFVDGGQGAVFADLTLTQTGGGAPLAVLLMFGVG